MPIEKRDAGKTRKARRPYRFDVCKRGHGMRDPENVVVSHKGYEACRTCNVERQRDKRAMKRAVRVRRANRLREFKAVEATRPANGQLGRQGDMDRMLEVVRLRRDVQFLRTEVQLLQAGTRAGDELVGNLNTRFAGLMGENAELSSRRRFRTAHHLGRGFVAGAVVVAAAATLFNWIL